MLIKANGSTQEKVRFDTETRRRVRQEHDQLYGKGVFMRHKDRPARADYSFHRDCDKILTDMRRFPKERARLSKEYHALQRSKRKYG